MGNVSSFNFNQHHSVDDEALDAQSETVSKSIDGQEKQLAMSSMTAGNASTSASLEKKQTSTPPDD
jgi:hypothetical protein